jgi:hypothetical protein
MNNYEQNGQIVLKIKLEVTALSVSKKLQGNHTGKIFFCNRIVMLF